MATSSATLALPEGVLIFGRFAGVEGDQFPKLLIDCTAPGRPNAFRRQVDFTGFSRGTGEPTEVGKSVRDLVVGEYIAVGVYVDARQFKRKNDDPQGRWRKGEVFAMATFSATSITPVRGD